MHYNRLLANKMTLVLHSHSRSRTVDAIGADHTVAVFCTTPVYGCRFDMKLYAGCSGAPLLPSTVSSSSSLVTSASGCAATKSTDSYSSDDARELGRVSRISRMPATTAEAGGI